MARLFGSIAACLLTVAAAHAQPARDDEDADNRPPSRAGRDADEDSDRGSFRGRDERGDDRGGPGGREGGRGDFFRRMNPMFEALDADKDGKISDRELKRAALALKKLDADKDGALSLEEVSPRGGPGGPGGRFGGGPGGPFGGGPGGDVNQMADQIMQQDRNGDGNLSLDEVDQRTAQMLQRADMNRDMKINRDELMQALQQMQQRMGGGQGGPGGRFGGGGDTGMTERLMSNDRNKDGKLSWDEVPEDAKDLLKGRDLNEDGFLDASEMERFSRGQGRQYGNRPFRGPEGGERPGRDGGDEDGDRRPRGGKEDEDR